MTDDKDRSLGKLASQESIISQLVKIGSERYQRQHAKPLSFIENLQCLELNGQRLRRISVDASKKRKYVALSYTWNPSEHEDHESGRYHVERWDDNRTEPSEVRNCVLDRVLGYMRSVKVKFLWIDRHCIRQDTCDTACTLHKNCAQKRDAIQAMDLVYQRSTHPVALLGRRMQKASELHTFKRILSGSLVDKYTLGLSEGATIDEARGALRLLHEITKDLWWRRAWTFQENYRGGVKMQILIRHDPSLEPQKLEHPEFFGEIPGELCVHSVDFSEEATRLCLALREADSMLSREEFQWTSDVLGAAGRYKEMLDESRAMTPTVIADIEQRELLEPWDRLAIIANCCQYSVRLNYEALSQQRHSLSLSMLAMCLLNGEILNNNDDGSKTVAQLKTREFLEEQLFNSFSAPRDDPRKLTFNKGCRLTNVKLGWDGVQTKGHLWKLGHVVDTAMFSPELPWIDDPRGRLELNQRKGLLQLCQYLDNLNSPLAKDIAKDIDDHLANDTDTYLADIAGARDYTPFTEVHLHRMASELATAILEGQKLMLGSIWYPEGSLKGSRKEYSARAIFVLPNDTCQKQKTCFTSTWSQDPGSTVHDANDIDRHVSLEVRVPYVDNGKAHLRVRSGLLGMCFFPGCPRIEVVFPWPQALQNVKPRKNNG